MRFVNAGLQLGEVKGIDRTPDARLFGLGMSAGTGSRLFKMCR